MLELSPDVIDVWFADLTCLAVNQSHCYTILDTFEQSIAASFKHALLRDRYVLGHAVLRVLLGGYLQVPPETLKFARTLQGKPFLVDYPTLSFNVSHSDTYWVLAVANHVALGIDIEAVKPRQHLAGLVKRCFAPEEQRFWHALPEVAQLPGFFDFWTRKEAFVKAVGQGITLGLARCVVDPGNLQRFLRIPVECGLVESWRAEALNLDIPCRLAVVANSPALVLKFCQVDAYLKQVAWVGG